MVENLVGAVKGLLRITFFTLIGLFFYKEMYYHSLGVFLLFLWLEIRLLRSLIENKVVDTDYSNEWSEIPDVRNQEESN